MIRYIFTTLFSLLVYSVPVYSAVPAQPASSEVTDVIAPLIDDQTYLIVHFNLKEIDFDKILEKTIMFFEDGLKTQNSNIDALGMTRIRVNLTRQYNYIVREFREIREQLVTDAGIDDIFLVAYTDTMSHVPFILAVQAKDKTSEQRRAFARIVKGAFPIMFSERGFMITAAPSASDVRGEAENTIKTKIKDLKPASKPYLKLAFSQQQGNAITVVAIMPPDIGTKIAAIPRNENGPNRILDLVKVVTDRIQWFSAGISVQNEAAQIILQAKSTRNANEIISAIKGTADLVLKDIQDNPSTVISTTQFTDRLKKITEQFTPTINDETQLVLMIDRSKAVAFEQTVVQLVAWLQTAQSFSWANQCSLNLKALSVAFNKYKDDKGEYPPAWTTDPLGKPLHSWRVLILPYLDEEDLYNTIRLDEPWDSPHNRQFHTKMPTVFRCPASINATNSTTTYALVVGPDTFPEGPKAMKPEDLQDAADATIQIVERKNPVCWMKPEEIPQDIALRGIGIDKGLGSNHARPGFHIVLFDSTSRYVPDTVSSSIFRGILTQRGGEKINMQQDK